MPLNSASKHSTPFIAFAGGSYANGRGVDERNKDERRIRCRQRDAVKRGVANSGNKGAEKDRETARRRSIARCHVSTGCRVP